MHSRVPLRTGRVFYAVAWAVSEGPDKLVLLWGFGMDDGERGKRREGVLERMVTGRRKV